MVDAERRSPCLGGSAPVATAPGDAFSLETPGAEGWGAVSAAEVAVSAASGVDSGNGASGGKTFVSGAGGS